MSNEQESWLQDAPSEFEEKINQLLKSYNIELEDLEPHHITVGGTAYEIKIRNIVLSSETNIIYNSLQQGGVFSIYTPVEELHIAVRSDGIIQVHGLFEDPEHINRDPDLKRLYEKLYSIRLDKEKIGNEEHEALEQEFSSRITAVRRNPIAKYNDLDWCVYGQNLMIELTDYVERHAELTGLPSPTSKAR